MPKELGKLLRKRFIGDLIAAQDDLIELAKRYELSPDDLAAWIGDSKNQRCLTGLCMLADLQTQLLVSRYRSIAASRLYRLADADEDAADARRETARKACADLLRLDLKRADAAASPAIESDANDEDDDMAAVRAIHELLSQPLKD